jgi:LysM repeat protein
MTAFPSPMPTLSPFPTLAPSTSTPSPVFDGGQGGPLGGPTATWTAQAVVIAPTFTPPPTVVVVIVQPTFTPLPTYTPPPTYTSQPTFTPPPTAVPIEATRTPLPTFTPVVPQTSGVGPTATFTSVPFMQIAATATYTPYAPGAVAPAPGPVEAVPLGELPTETLAGGQDGQGGPIVMDTPAAVAQVATLTPTPPFMAPPTLTPLPVAQGPTLTGGQMTATQIVYGATATMAFLMGTQLPPPTPFGAELQPVQPIQPGQLPPNATVVTATPVGQPGMCAEHRIAINETLYRIAAQYGVTVQAISAANNIVNPDLIEAGKTLQIPCPATPTLTPVPAQQGTGTTPSGTTSQQIYTVQAGDNIYRIALKFGVDMGELVRLNGLNEVSMNMIYVGQQLTIPVAAIVPTPVPGALPTLTPYIIIVTPVPGTVG